MAGASSSAFPDDFIPFNFSAREKMSGPVVFAGYGITAPEYNYDDYKGIDVRDKIVLILRHEPQEFDEKSVFAGKVYTQHSQFWSKASNAKMHGARGVILMNDRAAHPGEAEELEKFAEVAGPGDAGIPFLQMKSEVADRWFAEAGKSARRDSERHRQGPATAVVRLPELAPGGRELWTWSAS